MLINAFSHPSSFILHPFCALTSPITLEYLLWWQAALLFGVLGLIILLLGMRSMNGLGPVRKWVAIGIRLAVLLVFILIIGGARWQRQNKDLEVIVLRDVSESTAQVREFPRKTLQELALRLGADVPVFVFGQTAFAEGVGEILHAVSAPPAWYVVLMPPVQVPTAAIFAVPELTRNTPPLKIAPFSAGMGRNDLQSVVVSRYPEVARHLEWLANFGEARMTGSGACVFASFGTEEAARGVLRRLPETMQGFVAQGLDRHPLYEYCD